ncbi:hypothetical protein BDQ94DRAFT_152334 [Aspergillus welwitschiae]|uniref:Uncharacterized protein n=1 Tax=Aspergillus welwitschiae TaxID=1341132 RepID=A0A3F3PMQ3_9EURO|nr:hypothetical protein BDQ94DRAFT_152334 [Aspergillus welwitschiae]RDH28220.1 hypothetical protein BDQ94DRAFT_152334 [Aspergillus welwitschiae]
MGSWYFWDVISGFGRLTFGRQPGLTVAPMDEPRRMIGGEGPTGTTPHILRDCGWLSSAPVFHESRGILRFRTQGATQSYEARPHERDTSRSRREGSVTVQLLVKPREI